ncbi:MAG: uracil-DNA glycosylase family protein [Candidatus Amoebophilus sp.]
MNIKGCKKCSLCINQLPLVDKKVSADIMWVGLSAKKVEDVRNTTPLSNDTNSGKLIDHIESGLNKFRFMKTNLVKCLPLDEQLKLRYPTTDEMKKCYSNLQEEIKTVKPKVIFLLGINVAKFVLKDKKVTITGLDNNYNYSYYRHNELFYVPVHHPSYIHIYKRKQIELYSQGIELVINEIYNKLDINKEKVMEIA